MNPRSLFCSTIILCAAAAAALADEWQPPPMPAWAGETSMSEIAEYLNKIAPSGGFPAAAMKKMRSVQPGWYELPSGVPVPCREPRIYEGAAGEGFYLICVYE